MMSADNLTHSYRGHTCGVSFSSVRQEEVRVHLPCVWLREGVQPGWVEPFFGVFGWRQQGTERTQERYIRWRCGLALSHEIWRTSSLRSALTRRLSPVTAPSLSRLSSLLPHAPISLPSLQPSARSCGRNACRLQRRLLLRRRLRGRAGERRGDGSQHQQQLHGRGQGGEGHRRRPRRRRAPAEEAMAAAAHRSSGGGHGGGRREGGAVVGRLAEAADGAGGPSARRSVARQGRQARWGRQGGGTRAGCSSASWRRSPQGVPVAPELAPTSCAAGAPLRKKVRERKKEKEKGERKKIKRKRKG